MSDELPTGDFSKLAQRMAALDRGERLWAAELADATDRADSLAARLDQALADADAIRSSYERSLSWRVTRPFRWVSRHVRHRGA